MKRYVIAALVALSMAGCAAQHEDGLGDQLAQFRTTRQLYNNAYLRCNELVREKWHKALFGAGNLEGAARDESVRASYAEYHQCSQNYNRKMKALWDSQSPEVHAFYEARRAELHKEQRAINAEALR